MQPLVLHHYDQSPFSEKVRKLLAHKRLAWRAVEQPTIMPKPDLVPLTGGYRRIPVLQIGADVYCDSQLIARTLERLHPEPTIYPGGSGATCHAMALWADRFLFMAAVAVVFDEIGAFVPPEFIADRTKMMPGRDFNDIPKQAPHAREQLRSLTAELDAQLADGRPWLLGTAFSLADAACFHPLWFLRAAPKAPSLLQDLTHLQAWIARVDALGHGDRQDMTPAEALAIARESTPATQPATDPNEPNDLRAGDQVTVTPDDYAFDPVAGQVVSCDPREFAVRRRDPALGEIIVHFPRVGFRVQAA